MVDNTTGGTVDIDNIYSPMPDARSYHAKSGSINEYEGGLAKLATKMLGHSKVFGEIDAEQFINGICKSKPHGGEDSVAESSAEPSSSTRIPIRDIFAMNTDDVNDGSQCIRRQAFWRIQLFKGDRFTADGILDDGDITTSTKKTAVSN